MNPDATEMPSWQAPGLGTMKRAALWLVQEVGQGNIFTKGQLRDAFPGTSQIDRRMRDLRDHGWRIDTNREDASLGTHEQLFVSQGTQVWLPGQAGRPSQKTFTDTERRSMIERDGHFCRSCGISAGEVYAGTVRRAQLDIARRKVSGSAGNTDVMTIVECTRCRVGGRDLVADPEVVEQRIAALPALEREMVIDWIQKDSRSMSEAEEVWASYRSLPADARDQVQAHLS